jgi:tetratricopeptide (TPR) repeat protein
MKPNKSLLLSCLLLFTFLLFSASLNAQRNQGNEDELIALQFYNSGEYDKAVVLYEKLYRKDPSIYFYNYYFECLMALEQFDKAEKLVKGLASKNPQIFRYQVDHGIVLEASGDQKKADRIFAETIAGLQPTEDTYNALAQYFRLRKKNDWATKTYEAGHVKIPSSILLKYELSNAYFRDGRFEDMFGIFYLLIDNRQVAVSDIQQRLLAYFAADPSKTIAQSFAAYALRQSQRNAQNNDYAEMLLWSYLQVADFQRALQQAIAMDRRQKADGEIVLGLIPVLISNREYDKAIEGLAFIIEKGEKSVNFNSARIAMFEARYFKATAVVPADMKQMETIEKEMISFLNEVGVQQHTVSLVQKLASVQAFYLNNPSEAKIWIDRAMQIPGFRGILPAELKILLADIMLLTGEHWDASLLYSQVEKDFKHDTIGFRAKYKNAQFYYYIGEFDYALTHLNVLRAATSRLIANDAMELSLFIVNNIDYDSSYVPLSYYSRAEFAWKCKQPIPALLTIDSLLNIFPYHPIRDDAHFLSARIYSEMLEYQKAADHLHEILSKHYTDLLADDALFLLASIYSEHLVNVEKAMELYWQLVNDFPSSVYAQESREIYRQLRDQTRLP